MGERSEQERRFAAEVERARDAAGLTQESLGEQVFLSRSKVSEICNGRYLPTLSTAYRLIEVLRMERTRTLQLLDDARAARRRREKSENQSTVEVWDRLPVLPTEIDALLRAQISAAEALPYGLPGANHISLTTLYVRQGLGTGIGEAPVVGAGTDDHGSREDDHDPGWQSQNSERFLVPSLFGVRPPSRPIGEALDEHDHLVITGGPGRGKTTLTLRLAADIAQAWVSGGKGTDLPVVTPVIPLRLPARDLAARRRLAFKEALAESVMAEYGPLLNSPVPAELLAGPVNGCRWLLLVDAIDEVTNAADRESLIRGLSRWMAEQTDQAYRFVVTSRPLDEAGLAPLQRAGAATFELQPFDAAALRLFAEHWFSADLEAGRRFLNQVHAARLDDLIAVPLLATIAAIVFDRHGDNPLPDNKYDLYCDYLEYLEAARVPGDDPFSQALLSMKTELLEHLGQARVDTDAPLIPTAQAWVAGHIPTVRTPDWRGKLLAHLLAAGPLQMRGENLQFLHHSFAEHLAATAKARLLPTPFDPDSAPWRKALHNTCTAWTADHARAVLLHYTRLHADQADPLVDWLHRNTTDTQEVAADLLTRRAPVSAAVVDSFMVTVRSWALTSNSNGMEILRRAVPAAVSEWLDSLMNEPAAPWCSRIEAAGVLATRASSAAIRLLCDATENSTLDVTDRLAAAQALAKLGSPHHTAAVTGLTALLVDPAITDKARREAAVALAELGPDLQGRAVAELRSTLADPTAPVADIVHAAAGLAEIATEFHDEAAAVFRSIAGDETRTWTHRKDAALALGALNPAYLPEAARHLTDLADNRRTLLAYSYDAAGALAELGPQFVPVAATWLRKALSAPWMVPGLRRFAADALAHLGPAFHDEAAAHLRLVLSAPTSYANARVWAAISLAELGPEFQAEATVELKGLCDDPFVVGPDRTLLLSQLAKLDASVSEQALGELKTMATDDGSTAWDRFWAVYKLGDLDTESHPLVIETLRRILADNVADGEAHTRAATLLERHGPKLRGEAVRALRAVVGSPRVKSFRRAMAAEELIKIAPQWGAAATAALSDILADPSVRPRDRLDAAGRLIQLDRGNHAAAVEGVCELLATAPLPVLDAGDAGYNLARTGHAFRRIAAEKIRMIIADKDKEPGQHVRAVAALAYLDEEFLGEAAVVLRTLLTDPASTASDRSDAAEVLVRLGPEYWDGVVAQVSAVLEERLKGPNWRDTYNLAVVDHRFHALAVEAARAVVTAPESTVEMRCAAAVWLGNLDAVWRDRAICVLVDQVRDSTLTVSQRSKSAWELVSVDVSAKQIAIDYLAEAISDEGGDVAARAHAGHMLAYFDQARWRQVSDMLRHMSNSLDVKVGDRQQVLMELRLIRAITMPEMAQALLGLASDPTASASARSAITQLLRQNDYAPGATLLQVQRELLNDQMAGIDERIPAADSGLPRLEQVRALEEVIASPEFGQAMKRDALTHVARLDPESRAGAASALRAMGCRGLEPLGRINGRYRLEAIASARMMRCWRAICALDSLEADLDDATIQAIEHVLASRTWRSVNAARFLARFANPQRAIALAWLRSAVDDHHLNDYIRQDAARALAEWRQADRGHAVATLDDIAGRGASNVRWRAARALAEVAPECRDKAVAHLRDIMTTTPSARIEAATAIAEVDRRNLERAAIVLREVVKEPRFKRRALFALGELARPYSDEAVVGLRELMREPDWTTRWRAAEAMAKLRGDLREEASIVAREVANDGKAPWHVRRRAAAGLAKWSAICRDEARRILRELDGT